MKNVLILKAVSNVSARLENNTFYTNFDGYIDVSDGHFSQNVYFL